MIAAKAGLERPIAREIPLPASLFLACYTDFNLTWLDGKPVRVGRRV
jgi:hypothetical protein